jgi:chromosome segregation ATPase
MKYKSKTTRAELLKRIENQGITLSAIIADLRGQMEELSDLVTEGHKRADRAENKAVALTASLASVTKERDTFKAQWEHSARARFTDAKSADASLASVTSEVERLKSEKDYEGKEVLAAELAELRKRMGEAVEVLRGISSAFYSRRGVTTAQWRKRLSNIIPTPAPFALRAREESKMADQEIERIRNRYYKFLSIDTRDAHRGIAEEAPGWVLILLSKIDELERRAGGK